MVSNIYECVCPIADVLFLNGIYFRIDRKGSKARRRNALDDEDDDRFMDYGKTNVIAMRNGLPVWNRDRCYILLRGDVLAGQRYTFKADRKKVARTLGHIFTSIRCVVVKDVGDVKTAAISSDRPAYKILDILYTRI